ncbi:alpha/beta hydrolase [Prescottella agglutinans]|uniref:alpha/beta hydrolase n=1 Tax=Prescottella agglutinans TaxID=1644129 RepID=UPI001F4E5F29|nr:alpha/beta hydrolase [Prescottella agglutinans]
MTSGVEETRAELDPALRAVADAVAGSGLPPMVELDPDGARLRICGTLQSCAAGPEVDTVTTCSVGEHVTVRIYRPLVPRPVGTVVHFHGGGWVTGDLDYADATCRAIADRTGAAVVSADYRLAPEARFPAAVDDAMAVLRWLAAGPAGLDPRIVVTGDSAGGNLAAVCAQLARGDDRIELVGQVLVYPVVDTDLSRASYAANSGIFLGAREMQWFLEHYCPDATEWTSPLLAPVRAADLSGLPPAVVVVGGHDPLLDEGLEYAERLVASGVPVELLRYPTLPHGFLQFTAVSPASATALGEIAAAAARLLEEHSAQADPTSGGAHA